MKRVMRAVGRVLQPHMGKMIGLNRPPAINWLEDPRVRPPVKFFDPAMSYAYSKQTPAALDLKASKDMRRPFRILCLDGGGVRGILTTALLARICRHNPKFLSHIDMIAGTSAGGILSLLLAAGYSAQDCDDIYSFAAPHIFGVNPWRIINPFRAKYSDKAKQEILQYYFGERYMGDLEKCAAIVAFRLDGQKSQTHSFFNKEGWRPAVFSNMPQGAGTVTPDNDLKVWDAAMRTSAAPTYFPVFKGYTDGGIVANNPSIIAVSKAMAHYPHVTPRNVVVLSMGAGSYPRHTELFAPGKKHKANTIGTGSQIIRADWGIQQWIPFMLDLLLDGDSVTTEMVMQYLLGGNNLYHRLDPHLPQPVGLDDVTAMKSMQDFAQSVDITATLDFISNNFTDDHGDSDYDNIAYNSLDSAGEYHMAWERQHRSGSSQSAFVAGESASINSIGLSGVKAAATMSASSSSSSYMLSSPAASTSTAAAVFGRNIPTATASGETATTTTTVNSVTSNSVTSNSVTSNSVTSTVAGPPLSSPVVA